VTCVANVAGLSALMLGVSAVAPATAETSPYAGLHRRAVASLSEAEMADLLAGRGAGMALPAELNHYPGPRHVLDLAKQLDLSADQEAETRRLFESMQVEAKPLGKAVVAKETELDGLFASGSADEARLRAMVSEVVRARGELRFTHLKYHLAMRRLLTPQQIAAYDTLRGYGVPENGHHGQRPGRH
jgi:Spy/CpxP family protein refolding chaperone